MTRQPKVARNRPVSGSEWDAIPFTEETTRWTVRRDYGARVWFRVEPYHGVVRENKETGNLWVVRHERRLDAEGNVRDVPVCRHWRPSTRYIFETHAEALAHASELSVEALERASRELSDAFTRKEEAEMAMMAQRDYTEFERERMAKLAGGE